MSGGRAHRGSTSYMRPVKGFLGALDIVDHVPSRILIDEIFLYQPGQRPMGRPLEEVMTTMAYRVKRWADVEGNKVYRDEYHPRGTKEWILNGGIQAVLIYRFGFDTSLWIGQEVELFIEPCGSAKGGRTYGIRIMPIDGELDHEVMHERLLAHLPFKPPQTRQEDEPEAVAEHQDPYKSAASWAE